MCKPPPICAILILWPELTKTPGDPPGLTVSTPAWASESSGETVKRMDSVPWRVLMGTERGPTSVWPVLAPGRMCSLEPRTAGQ